MADSQEYVDAAEELEDWLTEHASELLSLAEEARWRNAETEPPADDGYVLAVNTIGVVEPRLFYDGRWASNLARPSHWRPLPRGPEEQ